MSGFQLDTSGGVDMRGPYSDDVALCWSDLTPFCQGYAEAMAAECAVKCTAVTLRNMRFSDLAPATLARIIGDCERFCEGVPATIQDTQSGRDCWVARQTGRLTASRRFHAFPPLTPYLGEDGLIYLREAA